jgi:hypothetical protein
MNGCPADLLVRDAPADHRPAIWAFLRQIIGVGEMFTSDRDRDEPTARRTSMHEPHREL